MRYLFTIFLICLSNVSFANSVAYLGKSADGKAVFSITRAQIDPSCSDCEAFKEVSLAVGSETQVFDDIEVGTNIVESELAVSDGTEVKFLNGNEANSPVVATTTITNASTAFVLHATAISSAMTIDAPLLLDAIKDNYDTNSTNTTAISNNTTAIANNATAIANNTKKISENATGVAEAMAIGVMQFDLSYDGLQTSIGGASFNGADGFAFMAGKKIQDNVFTSFSATSTGNYAGGISVKW